SAAGNLSERRLWGADASVTLGALAKGTSLAGRLDALRGRSVLLAVADQLPAALALIELDGIARRIVLCTPDVRAEHPPGIITTAAVEAVVGDPSAPDLAGAKVGLFLPCTPDIARAAPDR